MASVAGIDRRGVALVLVAGVAVVALALAIGGRHAERRLAGSNGIGSVEFVAIVGPRQELCQSGEVVPHGAGDVRMTIGTYGRPGPPLRTSVEAAGRRISGATLAPGWSEGVVDVPLGASAAPDAPDARVCVENRSPHRIAVGGAPTGRAGGARVAGRPARGRVRMEYIDAKPSSAWSLAGTIASRMGFARGVWAGLAPWAALALALLATGVAGRALLAAGARDDDGEDGAGSGGAEPARANDHTDAGGDRS